MRFSCSEPIQNASGRRRDTIRQPVHRLSSSLPRAAWPSCCSSNNIILSNTTELDGTRCEQCVSAAQNRSRMLPGGVETPSANPFTDYRPLSLEPLGHHVALRIILSFRIPLSWMGHDVNSAFQLLRTDPEYFQETQKHHSPTRSPIVVLSPSSRLAMMLLFE